MAKFIKAGDSYIDFAGLDVEIADAIREAVADRGTDIDCIYKVEKKPDGSVHVYFTGHVAQLTADEGKAILEYVSKKEEGDSKKEASESKKEAMPKAK